MANASKNRENFGCFCHKKLIMTALETLNNDITTENFTKKLPQIKEDLANYFEGLSLGTVEYILREFRDTTLKSRSILTIEKP